MTTGRFLSNLTGFNERKELFVIKRIGLLGSDNSHCDIFSAMLNLPDSPDYIVDAGASVSAIWGENTDRTLEVASANRIEQVLDSPKELVEKSDIVFVETRDGGLHLELARLALDAGKPVFVDKPLATTSADAIALVSAVEEIRVPMVSFSALRYGSDTIKFGEAIKDYGPVRYASYYGPASRTSPYGGIIFYAIHCVELMIHHHGMGIVDVRAVEYPEGGQLSNVAVTCGFEDNTLVTLGLICDGAYEFRMLAYGSDRVVDATLVNKDYYRATLQKILDALVHDKPCEISYEEMIRSIQVSEAIEISLSSGGKSVDPRDIS